jgi:hypothetical protein
MFRLENYANIRRVIQDNTYATSKHLIVKKQTISQSDELPTYAYIIKYNKQFIDETNVCTLGLFRSIIVQNDNIVCFSPQKSVPLHMIRDADNTEMSRFYDGTMINLYYNKIMNKWEIATRSVIGAECCFYDYNITFKTMFMDAFKINNLQFNDFDKQKCYSFVLQHPRNRIVSNINTPTVILTNSYTCINNIVTEHPIPVQFRVLCPIHYTYTIPDVLDMIKNNVIDFNEQGFVIYNKQTGMRTKIRNPIYEYVRRLKGNFSNLQYQYYNLRYCGKLHDYFLYYPEDKSIMITYEPHLRAWTHMLFTYYVDSHIRKILPIQHVPIEYRRHLYNLHTIYKTEKINKPFKITKRIVIHYVNNLHPKFYNTICK